MLMSNQRCPNIALLLNPNPALPLNSHEFTCRVGWTTWKIGRATSSPRERPGWNLTWTELSLARRSARCSFALPASSALLLQECIWFGDQVFELIWFAIPVSPSIHPLASDTFTFRGNRNDHPSPNIPFCIALFNFNVSPHKIYSPNCHRKLNKYIFLARVGIGDR